MNDRSESLSHSVKSHPHKIMMSIESNRRQTSIRNVAKYDYRMRFMDSPKTKAMKMLAGMMAKTGQSPSLSRAMSHADVCEATDRQPTDRWHDVDWFDELVKNRCERDDAEKMYRRSSLMQ